MKKQILIGLLVMIGMIGIAYGATTFTTVSSGSTISNTLVVNVTATSIYNVTNCTLSLTSTSATWANSNTTPLILNCADASSCNNATASLNTHTLRDANDWQFSGTCYMNNTATNGSATITAITGVIVNNGVPTCTLSGISKDEIYYIQDTNTVTLTSENGSSSAILFGGETDEAMTKGSWSGETITYSYDISNFRDSIYNIYATVTDGTDTTTCSRIDGVTLVKQRSAGQAKKQQITQQQAASQQATQQQQQPTTKKSGAVVIVLVGIGLYLWLKKKKG